MVCMASYCASTDAEFVIMLEDDVEFCASFMESIDLWMSRNFKPEKHKMVPIVAFFTPRKGVMGAFRAGHNIWKYTVAKFYGRQCILVPREFCDEIAEWFIANFRGRSGGHDLVLKNWMIHKFPNRPYLYSSVPCFVQHIGKKSSFIDRKKTTLKPVSFSFQGETWSYI